MSPDTWAVVIATAFGPIVAVTITLIYSRCESRRRERKVVSDQVYDRRLGIFRTLMATRRVGISGEHVNALNLIEIDFYKCVQVQAAWSAYKAHLFNSHAIEDDPWLEQKETLLSKLLFEIARVLDFEIPAIDIFKGGYAPKSWAYRDELYNETFEFFRELRRGEKALNLWIVGASPSAEINPLLEKLKQP